MKWNSIQWNQLKRKINLFYFCFVIDWMDGMSFIWLASFIEEFHSSNYGVNGYMFSLQANSHSISFNPSFIQSCFYSATVLISLYYSQRSLTFLPRLDCSSAGMLNCLLSWLWAGGPSTAHSLHSNEFHQFISITACLLSIKLAPAKTRQPLSLFL